MDWRSLIMATCISGISVMLPSQIPPAKNSLKQLPAEMSQQKLQQQAAAISLRIRSGGRVVGTGIAIRKQGSQYAVLTNEHVLKAGKAPYQIQTPDNKIYQGLEVKNANFKGNDLAMLHFTSSVEYTTTKLGVQPPKVGDAVFAGGFPFADEGAKDRGFVFKAGKVSHVLEKALEGGYQIGYTNDIEKGMSGGPLLNAGGELVGVNGVHAYPLWGDPYQYKDGTEPAPALREQMSKYSWGIPIATFKELAPTGFEMTNSLQK
ncbi:MAG: trypsin-like peptidase domain-containing protein [Richelia sp. CSU_2_1]|nr:trypsin-like peptidase domain-containing protein [Microcoleus sp. SM1_3_4]NJR26530.1 trypsin-like peptidase domain-containing protein [Richelia sp. CSU_2_1]